MNLEEVKVIVNRAKQNYQGALANADRALQSIVSQDPKHLKDAEALQGTYLKDLRVTELKPLLQPADASKQASLKHTPAGPASAPAPATKDAK